MAERTDSTAAGSTAFVQGAEAEWENLGGGIRRQLLGYDGSLMLVKVEFERGAVGALHNHPHRQVSYVDSGVFEVEIGDEKAVLREGDSFFVAPDVEHGVRALEAGVLLDVFTPGREEFA